MPIRYTKKISRSVGNNKDQATDLVVVKASFDRLVIYKDKNGNINQRIITYIPDKDYLVKHRGDISHNTITKLDKDFTGYLRYSSWDGKPLFMLKLTNGVAKKLKKLSLNSFNIEANANKSGSNGKISSGYDDCTFIIEYVWSQQCYYDSAEDTEPAYCDDPEIISETIVDMICPSDPTDDPCADPANFNNAECEDYEPPSEDPEQEDPCASKKPKANALNGILNNNASIASAIAATNVFGANGQEASFRVDKNSNNTYSATSPQDFPQGQEYSSTNIGPNTIGLGHGHDNDSFPEPSPADVYGLGEANQTHPNLRFSLVTTNTENYAIYVADPTAFATFAAAHSEASIADTTGNYNLNTNIGNDIATVGLESYQNWFAPVGLQRLSRRQPK